MRLALPSPAMRLGDLTHMLEDERVHSPLARGRRSEPYGLAYDTAFDRLIRHALAVRPVKGKETVLDAGCGTAALASSYVAAAGLPKRLDLLDPSKSTLVEARLRVGGAGETVQGSVGDPKLVRGSYDRILCGHMLEHTDEPETLLDWALKRLSPGGQLILSVSKPHWRTAPARWTHGNKAYRPSVVHAMLGEVGFGEIHPYAYTSGPPARLSHGYTAARPA